MCLLQALKHRWCALLEHINNPRQEATALCALMTNSGCGKRMQKLPILDAVMCSYFNAPLQLLPR